MIVTLVAALAASPLIVSGYFDGDWILLIALIVAFAAYAPAHLSRGIASGNGRFHAYAIVMGADGAVRIVLCSALAILGVKTVGLYGFAVAVSPLPGVLWVKAKGALRTEPGPPASWAEVTPNLGWLLLGSVFAAALVNAGPLAATLLADDTQQTSSSSPGSPTECSSPASRSSSSKPCRRRCFHDCRALRHATRSPSSAPGSRG